MSRFDPAEIARLRAELDRRCRLKYAADRMLAALGLPVLAAVGLVAQLGMWLEGVSDPLSRGPLFYLEDRWTQGRTFRIFKFRTTYRGTQQPGTVGRLTRTGFWLKKWYLDELPQLLNILRGEMTVVGPRPNVPDKARNEVELEGMRSKLLLRAGLTGLVQIYKRDAADRDVYARLEEQHLQATLGRSALGVLAEDVRLIARTVPMVLRGEGL